MSSTSEPRKALPIGVLEQQLEVLRNKGYHVTYPNGRKIIGSISGVLSPPFYTGLTFRVFFYAESLIDSPEVRVVWESADNTKYFIYMSIDSMGKVRTGYHYEETGNVVAFGVPDITAGSYYSLAIRINGTALMGLFNKNRGVGEASNSCDMGLKDGQIWFFKLTAGSHRIMSIHASDENKLHFPENGLGHHYFLQDMRLLIGSYGVFTVKYKGSSTLEVRFGQAPSAHGDKVSATFQNVALKLDQEFIVFVRNAPTGWLVQTSFDSTAQLVKRWSWEDIISPSFPQGDIMRAYLRSGLQE
ncbi:uncharacterized protein [Dermacentor albipictus]